MLSVYNGNMLSKMEGARVDAYRLLIADVYELAALSRRVSEVVAARHHVTVAQWQTLSVLSGGAATVPAIARRLGLTRQAVQRVADILSASGHVQRQDNPQHVRSPLYRLTPTGKRVLAALWESTDEPRALATKDISARELHTARETLRRLIAALT